MSTHVHVKTTRQIFTAVLFILSKIGLAFGGGGARGFALIGVVRALEEEGIKFDGAVGV